MRDADTAGTDCRSPLWESQRICVGPPYFPWCDLSLEKQRRTFWAGEGKHNVTAGFTEVVFLSLKTDSQPRQIPFACLHVGNWPHGILLSVVCLNN